MVTSDDPYPCDDDYGDEATGKTISFSTTQKAHFKMPERAESIKELLKLDGVRRAGWNLNEFGASMKNHSLSEPITGGILLPLALLGSGIAVIMMTRNKKVWFAEMRFKNTPGLPILGAIATSREEAERQMAEAVALGKKLTKKDTPAFDVTFFTERPDASLWIIWANLPNGTTIPMLYTVDSAMAVRLANEASKAFASDPTITLSVSKEKVPSRFIPSSLGDKQGGYGCLSGLGALK
jgi:hypothetical protein